MGLFSRKKKLSKEERKVLDKAREELQKTKEQNKSNQEDIKKLEQCRKEELEYKKQQEKENSDTPIKNIAITHEYNPDPKKLEEQKQQNDKLKIEQLQLEQKEIEVFNAKVEQDLNKKQEEFNDENNIQINDSIDNSENTQSVCSVSNCNKQVDFFSGKKCKFCKKQFCFEHIQLEKHECVKTTPTKYLRKTWLRRYDLNISSGKYIVVCDDCGYVSGYGVLIDEAGDDRKYHVENNHCDTKRVFLEEDLSEEKVEKNINLEQVVPSDRNFWVCSHCRPAQKFTNRSEYIAHHFSHG